MEMRIYTPSEIISPRMIHNRLEFEQLFILEKYPKVMS